MIVYVIKDTSLIKTGIILKLSLLKAKTDMKNNRDKRKVFLKFFRLKEKANIPNNFFRQTFKKFFSISNQEFFFLEFKIVNSAQILIIDKFKKSSPINIRNKCHLSEIYFFY